MADMTKIRAVGPWALVRLIKSEGPDGLTRTKSGLLLTETGEKILGHATGELLSLGSGVWDEKKKVRRRVHLEPGDTVHFRWYLAGLQKVNDHTQWDLDGDYFFIHMDDLVGKDEQCPS